MTAQIFGARVARSCSAGSRPRTSSARRSPRLARARCEPSSATYLEAFMFAGLLCLGAALMVLFIGRSGQERLPRPQRSRDSRNQMMDASAVRAALDGKKI